MRVPPVLGSFVTQIGLYIITVITSWLPWLRFVHVILVIIYYDHYFFHSSLYRAIKELAGSRLQDGTGKKPNYRLMCIASYVYLKTIESIVCQLAIITANIPLLSQSP